jgi:hypothetical protein
VVIQALSAFHTTHEQAALVAMLSQRVREAHPAIANSTGAHRSNARIAGEMLDRAVRGAWSEPLEVRRAKRNDAQLPSDSFALK